MVRSLLSLLLAAALSTVGACDIGFWGAEEECDETVTVRVSGDPQVRFSWSSECRIIELVVREEATSNPVWLVRNRRGLKSNIRYGSLPGNATESITAVPLETGESYRVSIGAPGDEDTIVYVGRSSFIAP